VRVERNTHIDHVRAHVREQDLDLVRHLLHVIDDDLARVRNQSVTQDDPDLAPTLDIVVRIESQNETVDRVVDDDLGRHLVLIGLLFDALYSHSFRTDLTIYLIKL
jgi:hypothetical protein